MNDGLCYLLDGPHGSTECLKSIVDDVLEDWLDDAVGLDNGARLVVCDGVRYVGVGGLSHGVGYNCDLGADHSEGVGLVQWRLLRSGLEPSSIKRRALPRQEMGHQQPWLHSWIQGRSERGRGDYFHTNLHGS